MPDLRLLPNTEASPDLLLEIRRLLVQSFAGEFSEQDWEHSCGGWHVVVAEGDAVLAHAAVVARELQVADRTLNAGYVEGVATAPARQGEGLGSLAMAAAGEWLRREFEMGALSTGSHEFYARHGWVRYRGPTYAQRGPDLIRTADDDDSVMVLRFGRSAGLDLSARLSCEGRRGEDW